jgi:hypothetical protein
MSDEEVPHPVNDLLEGAGLCIAQSLQRRISFVNRLKMNSLADLMPRRLAFDSFLGTSNLDAANCSCGDASRRRDAADNQQRHGHCAVRHAASAIPSKPRSDGLY